MSENNGTFDLSGVFQVQQNYLTDLSNSYPDVNNGPVIAKYMLDLQNKVNDVTQSYKDANTSADNVLTEQNQMIDIVETEQNRLKKKKELIDQAEMEERRKVLLTNSNRLRNAEWTKIILVFIFCITIHILLIVLYKYLFSETESDSVFSIFALLHIGNFALWIIVAFYLYINIQTRSQINFDQLDLPPPDTTVGDSTPAVANYNNLFADLGMCVADSCCGPQTKYDSTLKKCVDVDYNPNLISENATPGSSPSEVKEGFDAQNGITTLTTSPQFIEGRTLQGWNTDSTYGYPIPVSEDTSDDETPFDPLTASEEELRAHTRNNVKNSMSGIMGSLKGMTTEPTIPNMNDIMGNMDPSSLLGKPLDTSTKCGFTTMTIDMNEHPIYAPHKNCAYLPRKFTLEQENIVSQGIEKRMTKYN